MSGTQTSNASSSALANDSPISNGSCAVTSEWFCKFHGREMGPLSFDRLVEFASQGKLGADDEVKMGVAGKWRRVGSMGRLVAVLPFAGATETCSLSKDSNAKAAAPVLKVRDSAKPNTDTVFRFATTATQVAAPAPKAPVASKPVPQAVPAQNVRLQAGELELIKAQTAHQATGHAVKQLIAWAYSPNLHPQWWAVIDGLQNGPVDFNAIFEWVVAGRLGANDYVRNGVFGQFQHVGNLPDLLTAASIMRQANEAFELAKAVAARPATVAPAVVAVAPPAANPVPVSVAVASPAPTVVTRPNPVTPAAPRPTEAAARPSLASSNDIQATEPRTSVSTYASNGGHTSSMASRAPVTRPLSTLPKPSKSSSHSSGGSFFEDLLDKLRDPSAIGGFAVCTVLLVVGGWYYMSADRSADIRRYQELKQLLTEVRAKREAKATDFSDVQNKAKKLATEMTAALKAQRTAGQPAKQHLLWAVRDELPRMMKEDPSVETQQEKNFSDRLSNAARYLNIKD